jgi:hypothetical protein
MVRIIKGDTIFCACGAIGFITFTGAAAPDARTHQALSALRLAAPAALARSGCVAPCACWTGGRTAFQT